MRWLCILFLAGHVLAADSPIALALRAIKMSEHDLSFSKTNVESELVLPEARTFLQQPLALPGCAEDVLASLKSVTNLVTLTLSPTKGKGLWSPARKTEILHFAQNDKLLDGIPPPVADAVQKIYDTALAIRPLLPKPDKAVFDAFALDAFRDSHAGLGIAPELLRRDDALELQDTELADAILAASDHFDRDALMTAFRTLAGAVDEAIAGLRTNQFTDEFQIETDTPLGKIIVGGVGKNVYTNDAFLILDLGGDDEYENSAGGANALGASSLRARQNNATYVAQNCQATGLPRARGINLPGTIGLAVPPSPSDASRRVDENDATYVAGNSPRTELPISIVVDLAGNDRYVSHGSVAQGAGVFGIGILVDCDGDDVYEAEHLSQGAGFFGCGLLADYGGRDRFVADTFAQGAAEFGTGILWQRSGDTTYRAARSAQGFGGTQGLGLLLDEAGNDSYFAGGKYPCDWLPGHNFSLAQGFGYGMRPFAGGGIGILCDLAGNDHYTADVYGQGASYWYAVGLLLDAEGDDRYDAYQYCQGAGIHLSSGALVDAAGTDTYSAAHICQGAAHDYAVGMLVDRAGNDSHRGDTTAQGAAINNSFALLLDQAGNDSYTGTDPKQSQAAGHDGDKREYGSIALLLDLAGHDWYSQGQSNNVVWLKPWYGAGLDTEWKNGRMEGWKDVGATFLSRPELPRKRLYSIAPVDPHHPIEHLLRVAISDKPDAGKAWDELKQQGTNALAYLVTRLDSPNVLVRAKTEELVDFLGTNSVPILIAGITTAKNDEVARLCCYFLARFGEQIRGTGVSPVQSARGKRTGRPFHYDEAVRAILPLLSRDITRPVAFYTLGHLRAPEAFAPAMAALNERELVRLRAAQALGKIGRRQAALAARATPALLAKLGDEFYDVRYAAEDALVGFGQSSVGPLRRAFGKASSRARPHIIAALARLGDKRALALAETEYRRDDPLVREAVIRSLRAALAGGK